MHKRVDCARNLYQRRLEKEKGIPGSFEINIDLKTDAGLDISSWIYTSTDQYAGGSALIGNQGDRLSFLINADSVKYNRNNLSLVYRKYRSNRFEIHCNGTSFDMAPILLFEKEALKDTTVSQDDVVEVIRVVEGLDAQT